MTKTVAVCSDQAGGSGVATALEYRQIGNAWTNLNATEANRTCLWRDAGTFSRLAVNASEANTTTSAVTFTMRVASVDSALAVSVGAGLSGFFEDTTDSVAVAAGDAVVCKITGPGTNQLLFDYVRAIFDTGDTSTSMSYVSPVSTSISAASQTSFYPLGGRQGSTQTTELQQQQIVRSPQTAKNLQAYVSANLRTTATTVKSRKNTADGAQSVSIGGSATGRFEDTTNTDSLASGDLFCLAIVTGTGTQAITIQNMGCTLKSATAWQELLASTAGVNTYADNGAVLYGKFAGGLPGDLVESEHQITMPFAANATNPRCRLTSNSRAVVQTFKLRLNGSDSSLSASIGSSATGIFEDAVSNVEIVDGDTINFSLATGASAATAIFKLAAITLRPHVSQPPIPRAQRPDMKHLLRR